MQKTITLSGEEITYTVRAHVRARTVRCTVYPGGKCVVTIPKRVSQRVVDAFLLEKSAWILKNVSEYKAIKPLLTEREERAQFERNKERARVFVTEQVEKFNAYYKFPYTRITIRNQKTRWGSCSVNGVLSLNYKVVLLPVELAEYIIVHELCHLKEFNHGKNFWRLVEEQIPDYKILRKRLKHISLHVREK